MSNALTSAKYLTPIASVAPTPAPSAHQEYKLTRHEYGWSEGCRCIANTGSCAQEIKDYEVFFFYILCFLCFLFF